MPPSQPMQTELGETIVRGTLSLPKEKHYEAPYAALLLCSEHAGPPIDEAFEDDCIAALNTSGMAVIHCERVEASQDDATDFAAATWHWIALNESLDTKRLAVLALGSGAIACLGLAQRTDTIKAICMLNPRIAAKDSDVDGEESPDASHVIASTIKLDNAAIQILRIPERMLEKSDLTHQNRTDLREQSASLEDITIPDDRVSDMTSRSRRAVLDELCRFLQHSLRSS